MTTRNMIPIEDCELIPEERRAVSSYFRNNIEDIPPIKPYKPVRHNDLHVKKPNNYKLKWYRRAWNWMDERVNWWGLTGVSLFVVSAAAVVGGIITLLALLYMG